MESLYLTRRLPWLVLCLGRPCNDESATTGDLKPNRFSPKLQRVTSFPRNMTFSRLQVELSLLGSQRNIHPPP